MSPPVDQTGEEDHVAVDQVAQDHAEEDLPPLSAETLPLYLPLWKDGALTPDLAAQVAEMAVGNAEAQTILALLDTADTAVETAFDDVLTAPLPLALARTAAEAGAALATPAEPIRARGLGKILTFSALAAAVAMIVGLPLAYHNGTLDGAETMRAEAAADLQRNHGWVAQIVGYHRLYSAESRHLVEVAANEADHIQTWIGKRTGRAFTIPDLSARGLEFRGARLLAVNGKPTAQLMYAPTGGGPAIGLCFLKTGKPDAAPTATDRDEFQIVTWRKDGFSFIAIGQQPSDLMQDVARDASVAL